MLKKCSVQHADVRFSHLVFSGVFVSFFPSLDEPVPVLPPFSFKLVFTSLKCGIDSEFVI